MTDSAQQRLAERLVELSKQGIERRAPIRFAYLQSLLLQAQARSGPVAERLLARVAQGVEQFQLDPKEEEVQGEPVPVSESLRILQRHLRGESADTGAPMTLKSVDVLRDTWVKLKQSQRVTEAICQPPEHAGPLNSHHLVIRSLETLRILSPAYLAHFMEYVDTVLLLQPAPTQESARARKSTDARGKARKR